MSTHDPHTTGCTCTHKETPMPRSFNADSAFETLAVTIRNAHLWDQGIWRSLDSRTPATDEDLNEVTVQDLGISECGTAFCYAGFHAAHKRITWQSDLTYVRGLLDTAVVLTKDMAEGIEYAYKLDLRDQFGEDTFMDAHTGRRFDREGLTKALGLPEDTSAAGLPPLYTANVEEWAQHDLGLAGTEVFSAVNSLARITMLLLLQLEDDRFQDELEQELIADDREVAFDDLSSSDVIMAKAKTLLPTLALEAQSTLDRHAKMSDLEKAHLSIMSTDFVLEEYIDWLNECINKIHPADVPLATHRPVEASQQ